MICCDFSKQRCQLNAALFQRTVWIVQSACIAGFVYSCKYFRDPVQLSGLKYCVKGGKFCIQLQKYLPFSLWMRSASRPFMHLIHLLFSEQHRKLREAGSQRPGHVLLSQTGYRAVKLEPIFINSTCLMTASD